MNKRDIKQTLSSVDETKRKLLKLGVYSAPALLFLGKVSGARASGQALRPNNNRSGDSGCGIFEKIITLGLCD